MEALRDLFIVVGIPAVIVYGCYLLDRELDLKRKAELEYREHDKREHRRSTQRLQEIREQFAKHGETDCEKVQ